jgi:hypothetical protein
MGLSFLDLEAINGGVSIRETARRPSSGAMAPPKVGRLSPPLGQSQEHTPLPRERRQVSRDFGIAASRRRLALLVERRKLVTTDARRADGLPFGAASARPAISVSYRAKTSL